MTRRRADDDPEVTEGEALFWELAAPLLEQVGVTRSTMMGYPCLRLDGAFFATCDKEGQLVVKIDEATVDRLLEGGQGLPFAPNGRRFREWVAIPYSRRRTWADHLDRALRAAARR